MLPCHLRTIGGKDDGWPPVIARCPNFIDVLEYDHGLSDKLAMVEEHRDLLVHRVLEINLNLIGVCAPD
jgi:hypothetical protein